MSKRSVFLFLVVLTVALLSAGQALAAAPPTTGLAAWYPFNGDVNDYSGNGNNGTVHGAILSPDRFGDSDKAYSFNGSDNYISIADNSVFNFVGSRLRLLPGSGSPDRFPALPDSAASSTAVIPASLKVMGLITPRYPTASGCWAAQVCRQRQR